MESIFRDDGSFSASRWNQEISDVERDALRSVSLPLMMISGPSGVAYNDDSQQPMWVLITGRCYYHKKDGTTQDLDVRVFDPRPRNYPCNPYDPFAPPHQNQECLEYLATLYRRACDETRDDMCNPSAQYPMLPWCLRSWHEVSWDEEKKDMLPSKTKKKGYVDLTPAWTIGANIPVGRVTRVHFSPDGTGYIKLKPGIKCDDRYHTTDVVVGFSICENQHPTRPCFCETRMVRYKVMFPCAKSEATYCAIAGYNFRCSYPYKRVFCEEEPITPLCGF